MGIDARNVTLNGLSVCAWDYGGLRQVMFFLMLHYSCLIIIIIITCRSISCLIMLIWATAAPAAL